MKKTVQVLKVQAFGKHYTVTMIRNTNNNPFRLYEHSVELANGYGLREHKKLVAKYQTLESCLWWLLQNVPEYRKDCGFDK